MRLLFVVSGRDVPSTRFRMLPYIPHLEWAGHRCDVAYSWPQKYDYFPAIGWRLSQRLKRSVRHWHAALAGWRKYDAIVIEREVFDDDTWNLESKFRAATRRLILDIDDGVFLLHPEKFDRIARMCDSAIAGNEWLAEYLSLRCDSVVTIPTCVKLADYPPRGAERQRLEKPHIGWIGTTHNVEFLAVAAAALRAIAKDTLFKLMIVAPSAEKLADVDLRGVDVEFRKWGPTTEVADISDMDLGIMPLPPGEEWMKYKCGLKLIQYLAVGIPGVASPIGVNEQILRNGRVGRAAASDAQWESAIRELLSSAELRVELGTAGRSLVEREYSIEGNWKKLEQVLSGQ